MQVEALVHGGVGTARGRLSKLVLGALAGVLRRLERAPLHPREGHGLARAVRRRLVRGVRLAEAGELDLLTTAISHELNEAVTDPYPVTAPVYPDRRPRAAVLRAIPHYVGLLSVYRLHRVWR